MAKNARRSSCREGYRLSCAYPNASLGWINAELRSMGVLESDEPDISERSAHHWLDYRAEGIHADDYPALNRWEIARSAIPPEFQDAS